MARAPRPGEPRSINPKVRSWVAVAAMNRNSAGPMGGTARQRNRRDRAEARAEARRWPD